jgi:hypothetical protein
MSSPLTISLALSFFMVAQMSHRLGVGRGDGRAEILQRGQRLKISLDGRNDKDPFSLPAVNDLGN